VLVDDHRGLLDRVSSLLSDDFDVAGVFTDSRQAIDAAPALDPDIIVLDINMPGLDGFQAMHALEHAGSQAPVVFLTLFDTEEYIAEAFRRGARGYVVKHRLVHDLTNALDHVLHGRHFAPSLTSMYQLADGSGSSHATQLYGDVSSFVAGVSAFLDVALRRGDATLIVATEDLREPIRARLALRGWNAGGPTGLARCLVVNANEALNRFMRGDDPDPDGLAEMIAELDLFRRTEADNETSRLTVFGNMAVPLMSSGNTAGAIAIERQWDALTRDRPFFTLCAYSTSCFHDGSDERWWTTCAEHSVVSHASGL
jgi:DNA-binding response OmpR family regulator